ncbi:MAG: hypothetical protein JXA73_22525 [Acidobacteria bacterium]|nr:hypothetical protein [Acidobacteriota bacterium]
MTATTRNEGCRPVREDAAERSREYVRRHWKYAAPISLSAQNSCQVPSSCGIDPFNVLFNQIQTHSLCISGMAFQDAWNIDLERLQRCCVHVATAQNRLIPFCAYYMTDSRGRRLIHRGAENLLK